MLDYNLDKNGENLEEDAPFNVLTSALKDNPFPGLRPFTLDECHLFFGREGQVDEVLVKLAENRFVSIMGYSGSGKSSLMHCGLIPILHGGFVTETGPTWNIVTVRPGSSPIENLAESLMAADSSYDEMTTEEALVNRTVISSYLRSDPGNLTETIKRFESRRSENTLLFIDQFEELLRYKDRVGQAGYEDARIFVNLLLDACNNAENSIYVAMTMRSDYLGECAKFPGLTQMINQSNYLVPRMGRDQLRMAIEGPIAVGGGRISRQLVKRLLNTLGDNQDQLPILQHALMRTWDYWVKNREEGELIDLRHYNAVGKITHALSQHADEAYDELDSREKEIAEVLFKSLTERTSESFGMRRSVELGLVAELAEASEKEVIAVVEKFRQPGRSFLMPPITHKLESSSIIEISHESLMRIWTRLKAWVDEEFESAQMYRRLSEAAAMYQVGRTGLWRPPDLQLALNWQKKQKPTRSWAKRYDEAFERAIVFLDTSRITYEAEQRNQEMLQRRLIRRTKIVAVFLGFATVVSTAFFIYAYTQTIEADEQRAKALRESELAKEQANIAEMERDEARRQRAIADQQTLEAQRQENRAKEALEQFRIQKEIAERNETIAKQQTLIADQKRTEAQSQREKAESEFRRAEQNFNRAQQLLFQSVAQSMAVKSLTIEDNNLKGLLSQQAFLFNKEYNGRHYDPYIYNALYSSLAQSKGKVYNTIEGAHRNAVRSIVFDHSSNNFYSTGTEGIIVKSSLKNLSALSEIHANKYSNRVLAISHDDKWLINGSDSSKIQMLNLETQEMKTMPGHTSYINDIKFVPNTDKFVSVDGDKQLRLNYLSTASSKPLTVLAYELKTIDIDPTGKLLIGGSVEGQAVIIDLETLSETILVDQVGVPVHAVAFSKDGKWLAIGDEKGSLKLFDATSKTLVKEFVGHKGRISNIEFSPDNGLLATSSLDGTIQMWVMDQLDELPIKMTDNDSYVWDIAFSSDSNYILAACADGELRTWTTDPELMANGMCDELTRNMNEEEWRTYVGNDIEVNPTCTDFANKD